MECKCEECGGSGTIRCPECNGNGTYEGQIETISLEHNMHNYKELVELQKDAKRVIRQAARLREMNPSRTDSYDEQLKGTLLVINRMANKAAKK